MNQKPMLHIYNTLTKQKSPLQISIPGKVNLYVCGMTVYDYCHIGHARLFVVFDMVTRYLRHLGYDVTYVRNITDIDDKIIHRADENQENYQALTERFIQAMHEDFAALHILPPTIEPRATLYIDKMIALIQTLIEKNYAYVASNGDIYYAVHRFKPYGQLAHQSIKKLQAGARVSVNDAKTDPLDFVLWKLAKPNEPAWDSPWGKGRPGWHIECSAMALDCLGEQFDIHGGGFDLIFPHHQNEIAQTEAVTNQPFVHTWMHVGFLTVDKEKMSKSLNNFFTIREVLAKYPGEVVRYFMLTSHYRSQLNYSPALLMQAHTALERLYLALRSLPISDTATVWKNKDFETRFHQAMQDDFNTPEAVAVLFDIAHEINKVKSINVTKAAQLGQLLKKLGQLLGILQEAPDQFLQKSPDPVIEKLIDDRNNARQQKDWTKADAIRKKLEAMSIIIEDSVSGTTWRRL